LQDDQDFFVAVAVAVVRSKENGCTFLALLQHFVAAPRE
jgi:hypothetical protein